MIKVGDRLPPATFRVVVDDAMKPRTTDEIFKGKRVVLVGMPGAFTPTCHKNHLPGFLTNAEKIMAKGVNHIAVTAVNDHWVMHSLEPDHRWRRQDRVSRRHQRRVRQGTRARVRRDRRSRRRSLAALRDAGR